MGGEKNNDNDHDLLIRIDEKLRLFMTEVNTMKKDIDNKSDKTEFDRQMKNRVTVEDDHESRLRRLEKWGFGAVGALGLFQLIMSLVK